MQFISNGFKTFGFSFAASISCFSLFIFREFISALDRNPIDTTDTIFTELHRLCKKFVFPELAVKFSDFRSSTDGKDTETEDGDARGRIAAFEEKSNQHSHIIAMLQSEIKQLSTDFGRLVGAVSSLRSAAAGIQTLSDEVSALKAQIAQKLNDPVVEQLSMNFSELQKEVLTQKAQITLMSPTVPPSQKQSPPLSPAVSSFDSLDHFGLSGDIRSVPKRAISTSVAVKLRWFQSTRTPPPMSQSLKHSLPVCASCPIIVLNQT
jgi:hypothetical protein